jgi:uncharacterized protein YjbI with pentapeptide repeats
MAKPPDISQQQAPDDQPSGEIPVEMLIKRWEKYPELPGKIASLMREMGSKRDVAIIQALFLPNDDGLFDLERTLVNGDPFLDLRWIAWGGADLVGADLTDADLHYANMNNADLRNADLQLADLQYARLQGAKLVGADMRSASLYRAKLRSATLKNSKLAGASLGGADLAEADLTEADLTEVRLTDANLSGANLSGADLRGAILRGADLRGADLKTANIENTPFIHVPLGMLENFINTHFVGNESQSITWWNWNDNELISDKLPSHEEFLSLYSFDEAFVETKVPHAEQERMREFGNQMMDPAVDQSVAHKKAPIDDYDLESDYEQSSSGINQSDRSISEQSIETVDEPTQKRQAYTNLLRPQIASDYNDGHTVDKLGIQDEVDVLASLFADKDTPLPLSLGVFGNWGSGKTTYLDLIHNKIDELSAQAADNPDSPYISHVVHIRFNAWHFLDANLWAGIATEIFQRLYSAIREAPSLTDQQRKYQLADLNQKLAEQEGLVRELVGDSEEKQEQLEKTHQVYRDSLNQLSRSAAMRLLMKAGYPEGQARELAKELDFTLASKKSFGRRSLDLVLRLFSRGKRQWTIAALLGLAATFVINQFFPAVDLAQLSDNTIGNYLTPIIELLGGTTIGKILADLTSHRKEARDLVGGREGATSTQSPELATAHTTTEEQDLLRRMSRDAKERLLEAEDDLHRLRQEIDSLNPARALTQWLEGRNDKESYTASLGIVHRLHRDLETLSNYITKGDGALPINRVILYIDDLDRCEPKRVVEVLQAVHLLLGLPLFVALVAVDPRWLKHCLEKCYPDLLKVQKLHSADLAESNQNLAPATPFDYLEKIFQIPFRVRGMTKDGYIDLANDLMHAGAKDEMDQPPESVSQLGDSGTPQTIETTSDLDDIGSDLEDENDSAPKEIESDDDDDSVHVDGIDTGTPEEDQSAAVSENEAAAKEGLAIKHVVLSLEQHEQDVILAMEPIIHSPRTLKRLINVYQLVRAMLARQEGADVLEEGAPEAIIFTLAIGFSHPFASREFLKMALLNESDDESFYAATVNAMRELKVPFRKSNSDSSESDRSEVAILPAVLALQDDLKKLRNLFLAQKYNWPTVARMREYMPVISRFTFLDPFWEDENAFTESNTSADADPNDNSDSEEAEADIE